jgi:lipid A 4'-phosphatase
VQQKSEKDAGAPRRLCPQWYGAGLALAAASTVAVFSMYPQIDMSVARTFYLGDRHFFGLESTGVVVLRNVFRVMFWSAIAAAAYGLFKTYRGQANWLNASFRQWLFLAACLAVGPGLMTNLVLKDHWGRARPQQVIELGGTKHFTAPALLPVHECDRNCSFVSGEASSIFMMFFAAAFVWSAWSGWMASAGIALGLLSGLVRMAQGGHFLSDVLYAGIFMALIALMLHGLFSRASRPRSA